MPRKPVSRVFMKPRSVAAATIAASKHPVFVFTRLLLSLLRLHQSSPSLVRFAKLIFTKEPEFLPVRNAIWFSEFRGSSREFEDLLRRVCVCFSRHCGAERRECDPGKRVMGAPYSGTVDRMRSLFKLQHAATADYIRVPLVMLRRNFQTAVFFIRKLTSPPLLPPFLLYTVLWTLMLAATVTAAALSLEMGFGTATSPHAEIAEACALQVNKASPSCRRCFRLPLDGPRDDLCVPASLFKKSHMDFAVPPIFAALVVMASALFVQGLGLWSH